MNPRSRIPSKKYGQVFLKDRGIAEFEVDQLEPDADKSVLEIGAGPGILTSMLLERFSSVTALEPDHVLYEELLEKFSGSISAGTLKVIKENFLDLPPSGYDRIIGNIPYHISSQVIFRLGKFDFGKCILMVQKEFADRLLAKPDTPDYSRISINASLHFNVKRLKEVPRTFFTPVPKVDSTVISIEKKPDSLSIDYASFDALLIRLFSNRRKMVRSILENYPPEFGTRRPDSLTIEEIIEIFSCYKK